MLTNLRALFRSSAAAPQRKRPALYGPLGLESLEDRTAPSAVPMTAGVDPSSSSGGASSTGSTSTGSSSTGSTAQSSLSSLDRSTLISQAQGDQQEIILGAMAMQKGSTPGVQAYGSVLVHDHTADLITLMPILQQDGISLPAMSTTQLQTIQSLGGLQGTQFDQAFAAYMVQDHIQDIQTSFQELSQGTDPTVKNETLHALPVLETHLEIALSLELQQGQLQQVEQQVPQLLQLQQQGQTQLAQQQSQQQQGQQQTSASAQNTAGNTATGGTSNGNTTGSNTATGGSGVGGTTTTTQTAPGASSSTSATGPATTGTTTANSALGNSTPANYVNTYLANQVGSGI